MNQRFYVTTPIYYVNDVPHLGHAYTTLAADVLARWNRVQGKEVFYLTGTDEHGSKIAMAAESKGRDTKLYCDEMAAAFQDAWKSLKITNDAFLRTTSPHHEHSVQEFLRLLWEKGAIYSGTYEGKYCVQCERFLTDTELRDGLCPDHLTKPESQKENNYFFRLGSYRETLLEAITNPDHPLHFEVLPIERRNEVVGKLKQELNDISISRAVVTWGVPLPWDRSQTTYVWVDALLNYITALGFPENERNVAGWWPADLHLMAKDILWFHAVIWPALLIAADLKPPKRVFAHGFFTINGMKMSKTIGNVIHPHELQDAFGLDGARYLLLASFPFGADGDFAWNNLETQYNADLANDLGNLISRTLTMVKKYCDSKVPDREPGELGAQVQKILEPVGTHLERLEFHLALGTILKAVDAVNLHIEAKAPWTLAKTDLNATAQALYDALDGLWHISFHLWPFMPDTTELLWEALGGDAGHPQSFAQRYFERPETVRPGAGHPTTIIGPLFPRREKKK